MIGGGSIVIVHLASPSEKIWGLLARLDVLGAVIRGIQLESIEQWMLEVAGDEPPSLGLSTLFVPMARVEKIYLDEPAGQVPSYRQRFEDRVGVSVEAYLGIDDGDSTPPPS